MWPRLHPVFTALRLALCAAPPSTVARTHQALGRGLRCSKKPDILPHFFPPPNCIVCTSSWVVLPPPDHRFPTKHPALRRPDVISPTTRTSGRLPPTTPANLRVDGRRPCLVTKPTPHDPAYYFLTIARDGSALIATRSLGTPSCTSHADYKPSAQQTAAAKP